MQGVFLEGFLIGGQVEGLVGCGDEGDFFIGEEFVLELEVGDFLGLEGLRSLDGLVFGEEDKGYNFIRFLGVCEVQSEGGVFMIFGSVKIFSG